MDNVVSFSKSDLLGHDTSKESAHSNLLSDAMDFVKSHPVETAAGAAAVVAVVCGAGKIAANASRRGGAEADQMFRNVGEGLKIGERADLNFVGLSPVERGVNNITIGYGDPFFKHAVADELRAGESMSDEAIDAHIHKLLSTDEGQQALKEFAHSDGMHDLVARMKTDWDKLMPEKPFKMWSDLPHENSAAESLERFFRKELGENFGHDIPKKILTGEEEKIIAALRTEPVFSRPPLEQ